MGFPAFLPGETYTTRLPDLCVSIHRNSHAKDLLQVPSQVIHGAERQPRRRFAVEESLQCRKRTPVADDAFEAAG